MYLLKLEESLFLICQFLRFIMKLMKEHKEFTDETMKNELRLKCKSIIEELEDLKVVLKQIYDQNRNEIDEEEEMEDVDLHNEEENTLESNNEIDKEEVKEENKELLIKEENGKEMAHENIPSESDNTPNESDNIESISDFSFKNEIQKYFIDERREIYDRMVYESNSFKEKQNKVFHDDHVMKLSTPQLETTNIIKESNNIESFSKQTLNDNNQNVDIFPSFTQTIRGGQFNPDYIRPENLMTYGPTCTHKPSKSISNLSSSSLQPHIELPIQMNKKHPHEINNKPIPPMINIKPTSFPILTNQKPTISSNETVAKLTRIEIDGEILDSFMKCAFENSKKNIETCGNLAGKLDKERNVFTLTHVLIPKQKGTPDTCITSNEEDIVEYQIKNDLITLGWIHTHPSQACFLSSVDLHTHYSYQKLFNEAIAIVIAPRDNPK